MSHQPKFYKSFSWEGQEYEVTPTGHIVLYDRVDVANQIADSLGTEAKHCGNHWPDGRSCGITSWTTFSIVKYAEQNY